MIKHKTPHHNFPQIKMSNSRQLLIIDNSKIKQSYFSEVDKAEKKLDRLTQKITAFQNKDQQLYADWFNLTFRELQSEIVELNDEYMRLCRFHNWMIAESKMKKIPIAEALIRIREEEMLYKKGDESLKRIIEEKRTARDEFVQKSQSREDEEIRRQFNESIQNDFDEDDDSDEEQLSPKLKQLSDEFHSRTDEEIAQILEEKYASQIFMSDTLDLGFRVDDPSLFLRVWDIAQPEQKSEFRKHFKKFTNNKIDEIVEFMREELRQRERKKLNDQDSDAPDPVSQQKKAEAENAPKQDIAEIIKSTYRHLVRKLHPDHWKTQTDIDKIKEN